MDRWREEKGWKEGGKERGKEGMGEIKTGEGKKDN